MNFFVFAFLPILGILGKTLPESISVTADLTVVTIPDGRIIGTDNVTVDKQTTYYAFKGIPFAQPPLGNLRFAAPVKNEKWSGYLDASSDAEECVQGSGDDVRGSEDCLYVNVYTPSLTRKNQPVMVWIYGGAFTGGSSKYHHFGPDYFLEEDVVFVSFNYRVGIFGFLSTEDRVASGNWGLKDQVLALQWIKDNIEYFGGDPNKITIFGESAGGASVSYLLQIPKAQGLFNAAIMQSGTSEMLWALSTRARQTAFQVGYGLGIASLLSSTLIPRLRDIEAYRLQRQAASTLNTVYIINPLRGLVFAPVIEVQTDDAVFTVKSDDYFKSGGYPNKVPVLIGYNSNEGGSAHGLPELLRQYLSYIDIVSNTLAPFSLTATTAVRNIAANEIRLFYFGLNSIPEQHEQAVKLINTDQFNRGTIRVAQNIAPFAPTYFYIFGYEGEIVGNNSYDGVGHGEDLVYLFRSYTDEYSAKDLEVRAKLIRLWTNFAKTYNPTPTTDPLLDNVIWPAINPASGNIDFAWLNGTITLGQNPDQESYDFYNTIFDQFGDQTYTTY
jgi:carboxylesterase type B